MSPRGKRWTQLASVVRREQAVGSRGWHRLTKDDQVLVAPFLSFLAFTLLASGGDSVWTHAAALIVQLALFQFVVTSHIHRPRLKRAVLIAAPIVLVLLLTSIGAVTAYEGPSLGRGVADGASVCLTAAVILRMFERIARARVINMTVVVNAVSVYLLLGLLFAYAFMMIDAISASPFFVQGHQPVATFLYFSYITLCTIGYGDFAPAFSAGRFSAVAEGLIGQLYLVTFLAMIVANLGRARPVQEPPASEADDSSA